MSFTNQKPFVVTADDLRKWWAGKPNAEWFRCYLCGHKFRVGDTARWVWTGTGNPMVCKSCDGTNAEVIAKWNAMRLEARTRFWWFTRSKN